jgi:TRAP-type C4-dicarboxylate transport system permease small subunit
VASSGAPHNARDADDNAVTRELSRRQRDVAVVLWCSFIAAAAGTMLLFAWVDPASLADVTEPPLNVDRMTGYAIGFFFLWLLCIASAWLAVYLIRTRHGHPPPRP